LLGALILVAATIPQESVLAETEMATAGKTSTTADALTKASVIAGRIVDQGDHTVTLIRIRPPNLPRPIRPQPALTEADKRTFDRRANKISTSLSLFATSYPGIGTELTLRLDELEVHAFSNVDFRQFSPISEIETDTAVFSWMGIIGEGDPGSLPEPLRAALAEGLDATMADYAVVETKGSLSAAADIIDFLDAIHSYYAQNKVKLVAAYRRRLADEATQDARQRANPPKPLNATLHYWVNTDTPAAR
jgi:hypothetical protein